MPPALRIMCASPGFSPRQCSNRMRESMQASTAMWRLGRTESSPSVKLRAKISLAANSSSATDKCRFSGKSSLVVRRWPKTNRRCCFNDQRRTTNHQFTRYNRRVNLGVNLDDTIVAIATPPGRGGIGVVRLAGPAAQSIAVPMLRLKHKLEPAQAQVCDLIEASCGADTPVRETADTTTQPRIDEVVVTYFAHPHSYTTDDIVEISAHGSPVVLRHIVELSLAAGARLAEPGEFTMRAFLNGRLDLTQAEAVRDLIDSQTLFQAKVAAQQLAGALSNRLNPIKKNLVDLIALLEAGIDFAEDDVSIAQDAAILDRIGKIKAPLEQLAASFTYGKLVHQGLTLAIVGRPNVGKSSL